MKRFLTALILGFFIFAAGPATVPGGVASAYAQNQFNLQKSLKRLKNNPKYRGKVLGTRLVSTNQGQLVEVRILKQNDKIIIVYINPKTGGVVGDSG